MRRRAFGRDLIFSADDRYLFYASASPNLVHGQSNGRMNVYRWDRASFQSTLVSRAVDGAAGTGDSGFGGLAVSADGRFVAFDSTSPNLVRGVVAPGVHTYVLDVDNSTTKLADRTPTGAVSAGTRGSVAISANGRYLAFEAGQDVGGHDGAQPRLYRRDLMLGRTELVTVPGVELPVTGRRPTLSADGRYVGFVGEPVLVDPPTYPTTFAYPAEAYVRDMQLRSVRLVSAQPDGQPVGGGEPSSAIGSVAFSADGRFAAYATTDAHVLPFLTSSPGRVDTDNSYRAGPLH